MTLKKTLLYSVAVTLLASCGVDSTEQKADTADTATTVDVTGTEGETPEYLAQINAQDTLFEDGSIPTSWENAGFKDPLAFKKFMGQFKGWVKNGKVDEIAKHIHFPLKNAKSAEEFKAKYAEIFSQELKDKVSRQRLDRIFRNSNGAMISQGDIWFAPEGELFMITAINK